MKELEPTEEAYPLTQEPSHPVRHGSCLTPPHPEDQEGVTRAKGTQASRDTRHTAKPARRRKHATHAEHHDALRPERAMPNEQRRANSEQPDPTNS